MSNTKRDNLETSRKGRPKVGSIAMTPADRKRRQRQRARDAKFSDPSWLRLRKELFDYIFNRYVFTNVDELASALKALSCALVVANCQTKNCPSLAKDAFVAILNPASWVHGAFLPDLLPYTPDSVVVDEGFHDRRLFELYRDVFDSHENGGPAT